MVEATAAAGATTASGPLTLKLTPLSSTAPATTTPLSTADFTTTESTTSTTPYVYGGIHHMGKREAEAEADPQYIYNSALTYSPYTYSSGLYNNFYGYRHFYKREAEAEADPALVYTA